MRTVSSRLTPGLVGAYGSRPHLARRLNTSPKIPLTRISNDFKRCISNNTSKLGQKRTSQSTIMRQRPNVTNQEGKMTLWKLKSCGKCGGDLLISVGETGCIQCGQYYYPKPDLPIDYPRLTVTTSPGGTDTRRKRRRTGGLAGRNINSVVESQLASTQKWRDRNRQTITLLESGRTVTETAEASGQKLRQVRLVAERLRDLKF